MKKSIPYLVITSIVCLLSAFVYQRWDLTLPYTYGDVAADQFQILMFLKAAMDGNFAPFTPHIIPQLGAPGVANWSDFPMYSTVLLWVFGCIGRWVGLITAANLMVLVSHITSALGFYAACRLMRVRNLWAVTFALVWSFSFYHVNRILGHVLLAYDYLVPLAVAASWWVGTERHWHARTILLCSAISLLAGFGDTYTFFMWLQFLGFAVLFRMVVRRDWAALRVAILPVSLALLAFLASNWSYFANIRAHGPNPAALPRQYFMTELYALKPLELFIPPWASEAYKTQAFVKGEMCSPYLGIIGISALCVLLLSFAYRLYKRRCVTLHVPQIAWVGAFSCVGGINCFLALEFGLNQWRASNRFSIWILAICLLFAAGLMSRLARHMWRWVAVIIAASIVWVAVLDQTRRPMPDVKAELATLKNDQAFGALLEKELGGKAIVQIPMMNAIDGPTLGTCGPYEHIRPYLWTKTVRFSHGVILGRPEDEWRTKQLGAGSIEDMVRALKDKGYSALMFHRGAFDSRGESILAAFAVAGHRRVLMDGKEERVCIVLEEK